MVNYTTGQNIKSSLLTGISVETTAETKISSDTTFSNSEPGTEPTKARTKTTSNEVTTRLTTSEATTGSTAKNDEVAIKFSTYSEATTEHTTAERRAQSSIGGETAAGTTTFKVATRTTTTESVTTEETTGWTSESTSKPITSEVTTKPTFPITTSESTTSETTSVLTSSKSSSSTTISVTTQTTSEEISTKLTTTEATNMGFTTRDATTKKPTTGSATMVPIPPTVSPSATASESTYHVTETSRAVSTATEVLFASETHQLTESDVQTETTAPLCVKLDVVFILDTSISQSDWTETLLFTAAILDYFIVGEECLQNAVLSYSSTSAIQFYLNSHSDTKNVVDAVKNLTNESPGSTIYGLLSSLRELHRSAFVQETGDRHDAPNVAILLTDGEQSTSNDIAGALVTEATAIDELGIYSIVVSIGNIEDNSILRAISSTPKETFYLHVEHFDQLTSIDEDVADLLRDLLLDVSGETSMPTEKWHHSAQTGATDGTAAAEHSTRVSVEQDGHTTYPGEIITEHVTEAARNSTGLDMGLSDGNSDGVHWFVMGK